MSDAPQPGHGQNSGPSPLLQEMFKAHWRTEDEINSLRMKHMAAVGKLRERQADVRTRVKDGGFNVRAFKELIAEETDRRRAANRKAKLDDEDADAVDVQREALGDLAKLPLGMAALGEEPGEAAEKKAKRQGRRAASNAALDAVAGDQTEPNTKH
jgi:hypothetical protein